MASYFLFGYNSRLFNKNIKEYIDMIIGIEGGLGSGKTLMMTRYLIKDFLAGHTIYSNFHLNEIKYKLIDVMKILEDSTKGAALQDVSIGIDEITIFADCRSSMRKMNKVFSYFILQTRKRNVTLYYTTQDVSMVDIRLRRHTDIYVCADKVKDKNDKYIDDIRKYTIFDNRDKITRIYTQYLDISKYYKFYNTNEVILPPI